MIELIPWHEKASCRDVAGEGELNIFWGQSKAWQPYCAACPVAWDCLQYAVEQNEREGVYGGMPPERRSEFVRKHPDSTSKAAALDHRNYMKLLRRLTANDDRSERLRAGR